MSMAGPPNVAGVKGTPNDYNGENGLWTPRGWGANWRTARAAAGSRLVNIVGWGDSITLGLYSSALGTKGWFGKLATDLETSFGDGGSGFISVAEAPWGAGRVTASGASGNLAGGWDGINAGINTMQAFPHVGGSGVTLTIPFRGTALDIFWLKWTSASHQDFTYNIDGAGAVTVHTSSADGVTVDGQAGKTSIAGLSAGTHSVVITATVGTPIIFGVTGRNATGILPFAMSKSGRTTSDVNTAAASFMSAAELGGKQSIQNFTPDLLLVMLGVNDGVSSLTHSHTENTAASYAQNATTGQGGRTATSYIRQACEYARVANSSCEIVLMVPNFGKTVLSGGAQDPANAAQEYVTGIHALARTFNAAVLDLWNLGRNSWAYWNGLGYWGDGGTDGAAGTDVVHLSDAGHAFVELQLFTLLSG